MNLGWTEVRGKLNQIENNALVENCPAKPSKERLPRAAFAKILVGFLGRFSL